MGTTTGTITNVDGTYQLEVPAAAEILFFSYIGMLRQQVEIGNQTTINITLQPDIINDFIYVNHLTFVA